MPLVKLEYKPGVNLDDTPLSAEGGFVGADKVRFVRGKAQTIGGWDAATASTFTGIARGGHAWSDNIGRRWLAFGTATNLYVFGGGALTDITPAHSTSVLINSFTTTSGSPSVSVRHVDHGFLTGQVITFTNQATPVGGLTLSGAYTATVSDKDTYTVTAGSNATSSVAGGGGNVDFSAAFMPGLVNGLGEPGGYGSGGYSEGGYGGTVTSAATQPRTWSLDNWGENLLALPRGGALYEFQPATSYPELLTTGDFATSTGWTLGTGWTIGAGVATAAAAAGNNDLSHAVKMTAGKMYRVVFTVTMGAAGTTALAAGAFATTNGSSTVTMTANAHGMVVGDVFTVAGATAVATVTMNGTWVVASVVDANNVTFVAASAANAATTGGGGAATVSSPRLTVKTDTGTLGAASNSIQAAGTYSRPFRAPVNSASIVFTKNRHFAGTIDNVSISLASTAYRVIEAPSQSDAMFVDPHRLVVLVGTSLFGDVYNPMTIRWSDRENLQEWTPTPSNLAGDYLLSVGGRAINGLATRQQNLLWTDTALYTMRFNGDPSTVFLFDLAGTGCGLAGALAAAEHNGTAFWLSKDNFFVFQGSAPQVIPSALRRDMFENIADGQRDKIHAGIDAGFSEVWWLYPDARDGTECSRYVAFNFDENHWVPGTFARSTWVDPGVFEFPILLGTDGYIYFHEKGNTASGGVFTWELESAYADIEDGQNLTMIRRIVPDFEGQLGPVNIDVQLKSFPNAPERVHGSYEAAPNTQKIDLRATGRQVAFRFYGTSSPAFMRLGSIAVDVQRSGATR